MKKNQEFVKKVQLSFIINDIIYIFANVILSTYIHCDWGWSGKCNSYYFGEVFETSYGDFIPSKYFALKRDHKKIMVLLLNFKL